MAHFPSSVRVVLLLLYLFGTDCVYTDREKKKPILMDYSSDARDTVHVDLSTVTPLPNFRRAILWYKISGFFAFRINYTGEYVYIYIYI